MQAITLLVAVLVSSVAAHFRVYTPPARVNYSGVPELTFPCGGRPLGDRVDFPIVGGNITGKFGHDGGYGSLSAVVSDVDPKASDFNVNFIDLLGANSSYPNGNFSRAVDFSKVPGAKDGAKVTVQVSIFTGDASKNQTVEAFFGCIDLTLKDNRPAATYVAGSTPAGLYSSAKTVVASTMVALAAIAMF
ncbi:hypothetical protein HDU79_005202 [Rhizoclosmatium sp. JEL0117]|nr:hypothetical protein HDU79_005202 [Rhizoclosmatium sp. JEL0117]